MTSEMTHARTGRSMKKRANMIGLSSNDQVSRANSRLVSQFRRAPVEWSFTHRNRRMAKRRSESKLDEALRSLVQAQANLVQIQAFSQAQIAESQRRMAESEREMAEYRRESARELADYRRESA